MQANNVTPLIQCVIVLYKQTPDEAESLSSLLCICKDDFEIADKLAIFVQDNSPQFQGVVSGENLPAITYQHEPANPGLAVAYNNALELAQARKIPWLLLLDQDTALDHRFLLQLLEAIQSQASEGVCAFVPELVRDDRVCSPHTATRYAYRPLPMGFTGFASEPLVPCNSASCISVSAVVAIGGFPREYWLDFLDFIVFHKLQMAGGRICVLDSRLEHSLSLLNLEAEMSLTRYSNLLAAEWRFIRETGAGGGSLAHRLRLLKRALRHVMKWQSMAYARLTLKNVWR